MSSEIPPPPMGTYQQWGERLNNYLRRVREKLSFKDADSRASDNGLLIWDNENKYPVVSIDDEWVPLQTGGSQYDYAYIISTTDQAHTSADTAKGVEWDTRMVGQGITIDGTYPSRINFANSGVFQINFTAELYSTSSSTKSFYFWARVNGTDYSNTTMTSSIHNNGQHRVAARSAVFTMNAGDYLEAMWAVSDITGTLDAVAATAFCPAAPSATLTITEVSNV